MDDDLIANGVYASSGRYLAPPGREHELIERAASGLLTSAEYREHRWWTERYGIDDPERMPVAQVDPKNLASAGWGVIYGPEIGEGVKSALAPLLSRRKEQAAGTFFKSFNYQTGQSKQDFLIANGAGQGPADPQRIPYYLLIVGDPRAVPYRFQYELDVQYAVGRIHFENVEDYARYAESVVRAETAQERAPLPRQLAFFGVSNPDDRATQRTHDELIVPLTQDIQKAVEEHTPRWSIRQVLGEDAGKQRLTDLLGGPETPAFLFTASHGLGFHRGEPRQVAEQGALLCQDWPGPKAWSGEIPRDHYFAAEDLADGAHVHGLISFHFACYSAGTPDHDSFIDPGTVEPRRIAEKPFLASLSQRLLAHPKGGALAFVGHIDRAWTTSFNMSQGGQIQAFSGVLRRLLDGHPVGSAMEYINQRYAEFSVELTHHFEDRQLGRSPDRDKFTLTWVANNDAQGFVVLGDPAVRLKV